MKLTTKGLLIPIKDVPAVWSALRSAQESYNPHGRCGDCGGDAHGLLCHACYQQLSVHDALQVIADEITRLEGEAGERLFALLASAYQSWTERGLK